MRRTFVAVTVLTISALGLALAQESALKKLEGRYKAVILEKASGPAPKEILDAFSIIIMGNKLTLRLGDEEKLAEIKVDESKTPATIDISPTEGDQKGQVFPGIYKLEQNELTLVVVEKGERPKEFRAEGNAILIKLKRESK